MEVICGRDCRKAIGGKCIREALKIDSSGICTGYEKYRDFYREDNVVIYDDAGLPSVMVKISRPKDTEKIHPMFIIGGEVYDEIYISKYKNCIINGKAYSLPMQKPATDVNLEEAEQACFSKGEGWHLLTAAERGFLAQFCYDNNTLPHGNTNRGEWHGNPEEKCKTYDGYRMLTGSGPETWTHDHSVFGIDGLCGDIWEWFRGLRLMNGRLGIVPNNDAAMNIDLSENSPKWIPVEIGEDSVYMVTEGGIICFTTEAPEEDDYDGCRWEEVEFDFEIPEEMKNLGLFNGEPKAYIYVDTEGERLPVCGGGWSSTSGAGVFNVSLSGSRSNSGGYIGFRSAYYRKRKD